LVELAMQLQQKIDFLEEELDRQKIDIAEATRIAFEKVLSYFR
jgi:hypothetical protein